MFQIYKEGFLDGMRYSGHLLIDVSNDNLQLNDECAAAIDEGYLHCSASERGPKLHSFVRTIIEDYDRLYTRNRELEGKLGETKT